MTKCDSCGAELLASGVDFVEVVHPDTHEQYEISICIVNDDGPVDVESRDLCVICTAWWMIELLNPVAHPNKVENKD